MCKIFASLARSLILLCILFHPLVDCNMKVIFPAILCATNLFVPTATDCPEHHYNIDSKQFTWPATPSTDLWIPSDCLDVEKRLIFRQCSNDMWSPDNNEFELLCKYENNELPSNDCPTNFTSLQVQKPSPITICIKEKGLQYNYIVDRGVCIQDSIFSMEQSIDEQTQIITSLAHQSPSYNSLFVLGARWRYPCKEISKYVDYEKEDVELHDVRCGRFGLPLNVNSVVPVSCTEDICENMCLYLNATTTPSSQIIDECSEYVIAKPQKTFLHQLGCPSGYYRIEYDYVESGNHNECFSIQMFPEPIQVKDVENEHVLESYCNGTIMPMTWGDDLFVFRELSDQIGLTDGNYCLFGLTSSQIIKYSDWDSSYASRINLFDFNWDKTMNYSRIIAPGVESYLVVKPNGQWTWAVDSVSCIVCMVHSPLPLPELQLKYNILERRLDLEVTNQEFLYKEKSSDLGFICFSLFRQVYKANLTVSPIADGKYSIEDVGIGQYWCSGHNVIYRNYRSTGPEMFAYGIWFAFQIERKCATDCSFSPEDLNRFVSFFRRNNGFVSVKGSTIVENGQPISDTEYTFTVLLSLTLHDNAIDNLVTNLVNLTDYQLETVLIYQQLKDSRLYDDSNGMNITSIRSTEYCLHESTLSIDAIVWRVTLLGETISSSSLCPSQGGGSEITRTCSGDSVHGTVWEKAVNVPSCQTFVSESLLDIYANFTDPSQTTPILEHVKNRLEENIGILLPLDVFLTSRILQKVSNVTLDDLQNIFSIYNSLMLIDENLLKISASLNSTNVLLETFDNIVSDHIKSSIIGSSDYQKYGSSSIHSPFIKTFIFNSMKSDVNGIALFRRRSSTSDDDFTNYSLRFINSNETFGDLLTDEIAEKDLVVGSYLPPEMLHIFTDFTVVITVFFNDKLFQSTDVSSATDNVKVPGKIVYTKLLELDDSTNVPNKIPLVFESKESENSTCGFWTYTSTNGWSSNGCNLREIFVTQFQRLAVCICSHSTHIGYLVDANDGNSNTKDEDEIHATNSNMLAIATVITSSFSLFATFAILLTAVLAKKWREKLSSRILIHFAAAITCEMFLMILIKVDRRLLSVIAIRTLTCVATSLILHYSVLVMFVWMLIIVYLQFKRFAKVFNDSWSHLLVKCSIFGWVVPLLPVITILIVDHSLHSPVIRIVQNLCYPTGWSLYLGLISPIILIFVVNSVVFTSVLISLHRESKLKCWDDRTKTTLPQILLSASLYCTLGLTWIFGFLSEILQNYYSLFSYLFCVTAAIQGLLLLLYFIVFDPSVRSFWLRYLKKIIIREVRK